MSADALAGFGYSRGSGIHDNRPHQFEVGDFDGFVAALDADRAPTKAGAAYICGPLNGDGRRHAEGAMPRRWIAVDLDRIAPDVWPELRLWFAGRFRGSAWPTHSSKPDAPRERVLIELGRAATRTECIEVGRVIAADLADEFGAAVLVDPSTFRGEQPVFLPPVGVVFARFLGDPLDVDKYLQAAAALPAEPSRIDPEAGEIRAGKVTEGGRHAHLVRTASRMNWAGLSPEALRAALQAENLASCDPPKTDAEVSAIAADIQRRYSGQHGRDQQEAGDDAERRRERQRKQAQGAQSASADAVSDSGVSLTDFYAHMPSHSYLFVPTRETWPGSSVNGRVAWPLVNGKAVSPSSWLDMRRPVEQMVWHPAEPQIIDNRVMQVSGWVTHQGASVFNLYRPPNRPNGNARKAGPWLDHVRRVYPDDAEHIINWLAHRVQQPGDKCNHALVLGGLQGIGKDTILEPIKGAVGPWNWSDISPSQMLGRFNGWAKAVVIRVNEARDLGEVDRFAFYDHSKVIIAAPPDVLRVDEKHLRETYVANVCGVIITTNYAADGLYLPADDRRHYVAWSPRSRDDFGVDYWPALYRWFNEGGNGHVCAYLAGLNISGFEPKAPPPKTAAFWQIVATGEAPESGEMRDLIESLGDPSALTLGDLIGKAEALQQWAVVEDLRDRKIRRALPHKMERVGYVPVRNPDADDGLFKIGGRRQVVYAQRRLSVADQIRAARRKC